MILIDDNAFNWFKNEFPYEKPISIRLYPQYDGFGVQHKGFSLAISMEEPSLASLVQEMNGITFYVESNDTWFFDETKVELSVCEKSKELCATYIQQ